MQLPLLAGPFVMEHSQFTKFSPITVLVKRTIRKLRIDAGHSMNEGARLLGVSRKQLEDIETIRNYGCHLDLELLAKIKVIYRKSLDEIVGELPDDYYSEYFERPRKRAKSSSEHKLTHKCSMLPCPLWPAYYLESAITLKS